MSKNHKIISSYEMKDDALNKPMKFVTFEKVDENRERIFVKNAPVARPVTTVKIQIPEETIMPLPRQLEVCVFLLGHLTH